MELFCREITDEGLNSLGTFTQLQKLNLACGVKVTDKGLKSLESLTRLHTINQLRGRDQLIIILYVDLTWKLL